MHEAGIDAKGHRDYDESFYVHSFVGNLQRTQVRPDCFSQSNDISPAPQSIIRIEEHCQRLCLLDRKIDKILRLGAQRSTRHTRRKHNRHESSRGGIGEARSRP